MLKKTVIALGIAALTLTASVAGAEARSKNGGGFHRGHSHGKWHGHRFGYRHYGYRNYAYYPSYGGGCYIFKKKYYATGNGFWLRKYKECSYKY